MSIRKWRVVGLTKIAGLDDARWETYTRRFTRKGAERVATRWADKGRQAPGYPMIPLVVLGYGFIHEDEPLPSEPSLTHIHESRRL